MAISNPAKNKAKNKAKKKKARLSALHPPKDMSLEQWQRALRRQAAMTETFAVTPVASDSASFIVRSSNSNRSHKVSYFGDCSPLNRCSCMDFKTSRLGTCKHIEAISLAARGKYRHKNYKLPDHSFVYVDYVDFRKVKIHFGERPDPKMKELAASLFDSDGVLKDMTIDPSDFIRRASHIDPGFVWEPDALDVVIDNRDRQRRREIIAEKYARSGFEGLLKTSLHPYQADGVRFAFTGGRTINADEMGLGKTVQAIATAELLKRERLVDSVIIICPTSLKYQWLAEIRRFTDSSAEVIEGNILKRRELLSDTTHFYKICSFHAMSNTIKGGFIPQADMIIYDELQRLKNRETQMGKQLRLLNSQYVMALSGTPLENKIDELYSVTQLVDQFVLGPYYRFKAETTLIDDTGKIVGYKNLHKIADRLSQTLIRRRKADVKLQMPPRTDTNLYVPLTKEQRTIHDDYKFQVSAIIRKWRKFKFLNEADRKRLLLFLSMMRMVCDSTFILDQKTRHDTKIDEAKAIIANMLDSEGGKVVIFSQWERMLRILSAELENEEIEFCYLHGGVPSPKRKDLIDRFRDDPNCRIFLSTDAGATGLNLQSASLLINLDLPWNPAVLEQRIARIYRLGQANPVQIINMIATDSIEEQMLGKLKFKSQLSAGILDGGDDAIFIEESKFNQIIEIVDETITPVDDDQTSDDTAAPAEPHDDDAVSDSENTVENDATTEDKPENKHKHTDHTNDKTASDSTTSGRSADSQPPVNPVQQSDSTVSPTQQSPKNPSEHSVPKTPDAMRALVTDGLSALGKIADVLRQPDGAKTLTDAIVKEDPETGRATLNIPVPDKSTVTNLLTAISALLNR